MTANNTIPPSTTNFQTNPTQSFEELEEKVLSLDKDLKEAKENFEKGRFDLITRKNNANNL
jgi:hypothetical protein